MTRYRGGSTVGRYSSRCPAGRCAAEAEPGTSKLQQDLFTLLKLPFGGGDPDYRVGRYRADMAFRISSPASRGRQDDLMLVVEYDGAYWHAGRERGDFAKAEFISQAGGPEHHEVVRIREAPLDKLGRNDIAVPPRPDPWLCARLLAMHVLHEFGEWISLSALEGRLEHFLLAADGPLDSDQVDCRTCQLVAEYISDRAGQLLPPMGLSSPRGKTAPARGRTRF